MGDRALRTVLAGLGLSALAMIALCVSLWLPRQGRHGPAPQPVVAPSSPAMDKASAAVHAGLLPPADLVASAFLPRPVAPWPVAPAALPPAIEAADWLRPIGEAEDEGGAPWLLVKDSRQGRVVKFRLDGSPSDAGRIREVRADAYIVEYGSSILSIGRR